MSRPGRPAPSARTHTVTERGLTAGQAARQLGVAVTTLRSWHRRYGLGPTTHLPGRHRRYGADDLARLESMHILTAQGMSAAEAARMALAGVPVAAPDAPEDAAGSGVWAARAVRGLVDTAMRLDDDRARQLVERALARYGVIRTWDELVRPALTRIGDRHEATGRLVEVEHMFSRAVCGALTTVRAPAPEQAARVLLACADEEQHTLPLEALAAAAAERGVACRLLGARVPPAALQTAVRRTGPALLVVWSHARVTADPQQLRSLLAGDGRAPLLAATGPGWPVELPEGVVAPATLSEAVRLAVAVAHA